MIDVMMKNFVEIFGIDDKFGFVEVGKIVNFIVIDGDLFEIMMWIKYVFIGGKDIGFDNKYDVFYERYRVCGSC